MWSGHSSSRLPAEAMAFPGGVARTAHGLGFTLWPDRGRAANRHCENHTKDYCGTTSSQFSFMIDMRHQAQEELE